MLQQEATLLFLMECKFPIQDAVVVSTLSNASLLYRIGSVLVAEVPKLERLSGAFGGGGTAHATVCAAFTSACRLRARRVR
jgi:hypothetical protein